MFGDASKALGDDIDELAELYKSNSSPPVTRSLVRAYSAYIEASVFEMRQVALQRYRGNPELFSPEEESVLLEKSVFLDRKGKVQSKGDYQRFLPLVLFLSELTLGLMGQVLNQILVIIGGKAFSISLTSEIV
jgi:hypothetical protein